MHIYMHKHANNNPIYIPVIDGAIAHVQRFWRTRASKTGKTKMGKWYSCLKKRPRRMFSRNTQIRTRRVPAHGWRNNKPGSAVDSQNATPRMMMEKKGKWRLKIMVTQRNFLYVQKAYYLIYSWFVQYGWDGARPIGVCALDMAQHRSIYADMRSTLITSSRIWTFSTCKCQSGWMLAQSQSWAGRKMKLRWCTLGCEVCGEFTKTQARPFRWCAAQSGRVT